jgi:hypothetical protein
MKRKINHTDIFFIFEKDLNNTKKHKYANY